MFGVHFHFCISKYKFLYANSVDPDQMPHSAVADLGLHYLSMSQEWDPRHERVKNLSGFSTFSYIKANYWLSVLQQTKQYGKTVCRGKQFPNHQTLKVTHYII